MTKINTEHLYVCINVSNLSDRTKKLANRVLDELIESNKQMESDLKEVDRLCDEQYYEDDGANFYVDVELLKPITSKYKSEVCEHGKGVNDYCQPCGRIHSL